VANELNFEIVSNNDVTLEMAIVDGNGTGINGTGMSIKWSWYLPGQTVTKTTAGSTIIVSSVNPLIIQIPILATDTLGAPAGYYPHEAVTVDSNGKAVTVTNNDATISYGVGMLRQQLTVQ
jgi:hypothetical protein